MGLAGGGGAVQVLNESSPNLPEYLKPLGDRAEALLWAEPVTCRTQGWAGAAEVGFGDHL